MHALRSLVAGAAIAALAYAAAGASPAALTIKLYAQNRPGETGTATFEQVSGGVTIVVRMAGGQKRLAAHPYTHGQLRDAEPRRPEYALANIVHGSSTTTLPGVTLADLLAGQYVIDVHESSADLTKYVACAPIAMSK